MSPDLPQILGALAQAGSLPEMLIYSSSQSSSKQYCVHLESSMAISELI